MTCIALRNDDNRFFKSPVISLLSNKSWASRNNRSNDSALVSELTLETASESILETTPALLREHFMGSLYEAAHEASGEGWAGAGSKPVEKLAEAMAIRLFDLLPSNIKAPEPSVVLSGEISLDWADGNNRLFTILLKGNDKIAFAAYDRGERIFGSMEFHADALPEKITNELISWHSKQVE